jgi:hypothetical protein
LLGALISPQVLVTFAYVRTINQSLGANGSLSSTRDHQSRRTAGSEAASKQIAQAKWATIAGATLALVSGTVWYGNFILSGGMPERWYRDKWLNPFQFITMATVVSKNISMLLVSGMLTSGTLRKAGDRNQITPLSSATSRAPASALLAQSQLAGLGSISISEEFVPPQQQPRGVRLKLIAQVLQEGLFYSSSDTDAPRILNTAVAEIIDSDFVPTATDFFDECREGARLLVPEMRAGYQDVRKGHLVIYSDTLQQIRQETTFPELQRRSDALVQDCLRLNRPQEQQCHTVSGLLKSGEAVSKRYNALMAGVESKTGAKFHKAPLKGLVRIAEKMALTPPPKNGQPQRVTDVVRGAIECDNFTTMMNVVRLLRSLDTDLRSEVGCTGGITDKIVVTRSKGRFGKPTSRCTIVCFCPPPPVYPIPTSVCKCPNVFLM